MTDFEKATELIDCNPYSCKSSCVNFCQKTFHNGLMCKEKERLIKAMEWKEQQLIEKAAKWLKENCMDYSYDDYNNTAYIHTNDLIEDFKKAMLE